MIVLDHNIAHDQAQRLRRRRIHFRQVGFEVGRPEWDDQQEILRYLHATKQPTFFTRDLGFYRAPLRHANYCLVALTVPVMETAQYISKLLRHPHFNTRAKRNGKVIRVSTENIAFWEIGRQRDRAPSVGKGYLPRTMRSFPPKATLRSQNVVRPDTLFTESLYPPAPARSAESSGRSASLLSD